MKNFLLAVIIFATAGCAAYVTPQGTYLEPYPLVVIEPPVVVEAPPAVVVRPLPPVVVVPDRHLYFYNDFYYYNWDGGWYWSRNQRGPWHVLPRSHWPSRMEKRERGHERERGGSPQERERDYR